MIVHFQLVSDYTFAGNGSKHMHAEAIHGNRFTDSDLKTDGIKATHPISAAVHWAYEVS